MTFGLDPLDVLRRRRLDRLILTAAHNIAVREAKQASGDNDDVTPGIEDL